jgi:integrase/recombinase XerD
MKIKSLPVSHHGEPRIRLVFSNDRNIIGKVKMIPGARWSNTMKSWHVPQSEESERMIKEINDAMSREAEVQGELPPKEITGHYGGMIETFDPIYRPAMDKFLKWILGQRYSHRTVEVYNHSLVAFFRFMGGKPLEEITAKDISEFNYGYLLRKGFSRSSHNQFISAIKLFLKVNDVPNIKIKDLERPRKAFKLPEVLSLDEIQRVISVTSNLKHRAVISLTYSCALRRQEILNLKI